MGLCLAIMKSVRGKGGIYAKWSGWQGVGATGREAEAEPKGAPALNSRGVGLLPG